MYNANLHIKRGLKSKLPEPEIPSGEAWKQMQVLLEAEMPQPGAGAANKNFWKSRGFQLFSRLFIAGVSLVIIWGTIKWRNNREMKPAVATNGKDSTAFINVIPGSADAISAQDSAYPILTENNRNGQKQNKVNPANPEFLKNRPSKIITAVSNKNNPEEGKVVADANAHVQPAAIKDTPDKHPLTAKYDITIPFRTATDIPLKPAEKNSFNISSLIDELPSLNRINVTNTTPGGRFVAMDKGKTTETRNKKRNRNGGTLSFNGGNRFELRNNFYKRNGPRTKQYKNKGDNFFTDFHVGVQLSPQMGFTSPKGFFRGPTGKTEPWLNLNPGIWIARNIRNSETGIKFQPLSQVFMGNRELSSIEVNRLIDSLSIIKTTSLHKSFGYTIGVFYRLEIAQGFVAGVGLDYGFQNKALLSERLQRKNDGFLVSETFFGISKTSDQWQNFNSRYFSGNVELAWRYKWFDLGSTVNFPLSNLSANPNTGLKPVNASIFFRVKIK